MKELTPSDFLYITNEFGENPEKDTILIFCDSEEDREYLKQQILNCQKAVDHTTRLVHEIVNLKARIEKLIEELETGEDYGSNPCIRELKKLLEKQND